MTAAVTGWRVVATRSDGQRFFSWHSSKVEATQGAKDQRSRGLWKSVRVEPVKAAS